MEFPEINMISDFEAGVNCLQNPSLVSRFIKLPEVYHFWKWGALILAILATFSSLIRKIKLLFIYITTTLKPSAEPLLQYLGEDFDISDDDDDDNNDECSSSVSSDDDETFSDHQIDEEFIVSGSSFYFKEQGQNGNLRHRKQKSSYEKFSSSDRASKDSSCGFPWTEFTAGKNVVKLWDSLALGLDFNFDLDFNYDFNNDDLCKSVVSLWDLNKENEINEVGSPMRKASRVHATSPAVVLSSNDDGVLAAYDTRMKSQSPAICADWGTGKVIGVKGSGAGKIYVRNEANGVLTVGDLRNVKTPLEKITEGDNDTWWDADGVIIEDENFDGSD